MGELIDFQKFKEKKDLQEQKEKIIQARIILNGVSESSLAFMSIKDFLGENLVKYNYHQSEDGSAVIYLNILEIKYGDFQELKKIIEKKDIKYKVE